MYLRSRFDALSDGIFGVAMTLLVVDVRLPHEVAPGDSAAFLAEIGGLESKLWLYALSFAVLGLTWLGKAENRKAPEMIGRREAMIGIVYLFFVTLVPFSSMTLDAAPHIRYATWIYCANLGGLGLLSALIQRRWLADDPDEYDPEQRLSPLLLAGTAALAAALCLYTPDNCLWAFALNALGPVVERWRRMRRKSV